MEEKFEKELGQRLNERVISPSENAWERVQMQRRKPKKKRIIGPWAAVLAILLGLFWTMFTSEEPAAVVVDGPAEIPTPDSIVVPGPVAPAPAQIVQIPLKRQTSERRLVKEADSERSAPVDVFVPKVETTLVEVFPVAAPRSGINERIAVTKPVDEAAYFLEKARRELSQGGNALPATDAHTLLKNSESELDERYRTNTLESLFKHKRIKIALSK